MFSDESDASMVSTMGTLPRALAAAVMVGVPGSDACMVSTWVAFPRPVVAAVMVGVPGVVSM